MASKGLLAQLAACKRSLSKNFEYPFLAGPQPNVQMFKNLITSVFYTKMHKTFEHFLFSQNVQLFKVVESSDRGHLPLQSHERVKQSNEHFSLSPLTSST